MTEAALIAEALAAGKRVIVGHNFQAFEGAAPNELECVACGARIRTKPIPPPPAMILAADWVEDFRGPGVCPGRPVLH